jgi:sugar phosphate isomerase/epimerase
MSYPNAGWEESKWRDEVLKRISRLTDVAEDNDIVLLHENCDGWGGLGVQQTLAMIDHVDSPNLKLIWDTGNPVAHDQDAWEYYKGVREHVIYIHIKDGVRENGKVRYTFPGEGEGAVKDVLQDLIERDYRGCISIEPHISAVIHEGKSAETEHDSFNTYVEYGKRLMGLIESLG